MACLRHQRSGVEWFSIFAVTRDWGATWASPSGCSACKGKEQPGEGQSLAKRMLLLVDLVGDEDVGRERRSGESSQ